MQEFLIVKGARQHNLKNITVEIPRNKMVVITGLSGSGKSSLAFDTIYAEGQRRYVESLSAYARQFLGQMDKPDVDYIEGLSPAISIDQKTTSRNPRSTVGTVTEIYDYLRLLFARAGEPHCPKCGKLIEQQSVQQIVDKVLELQVEDNVIVERMSGRRVCEKCGASYHIVNKKSKVEGVCDLCGGKTVIRKDDQPATVLDRLKAYHEQTEPLVDFYRTRGKLAEIKFCPSIEETTAEVMKALEA